MKREAAYMFFETFVHMYSSSSRNGNGKKLKLKSIVLKMEVELSKTEMSSVHFLFGIAEVRLMKRR